MSNPFDRIGSLIFEIHKPRLMEQFKYHPNGEYLIEQMARGELTSSEVDSAFIAAEAYMAQEMFQNTSQDEPVNNVVSFEVYKNAKDTANRRALEGESSPA